MATTNLILYTRLWWLNKRITKLLEQGLADAQFAGIQLAQSGLLLLAALPGPKQTAAG